MKEIIQERVKSPEEIKKESLKEFSRVKKDDSEVLEVVKEIMVVERVAELEQIILDDQAEIDRRTAHKAESEAELAKYK